MGLISRVSSRTYRNQKNQPKTMAETDPVTTEFKTFHKIIDHNQQLLWNNRIRKIEHNSYLKASECTADLSKNVFQVRDCVKSSFSNLESAQKLMSAKLQTINSALEDCTNKCSDEAAKNAPNPERMSEMDLTRIRKNFNDCNRVCPREILGKVEDVFKELDESLKKFC